VEFGIFLNGYIPGPAAHDSESEHTELTREAEYVIHADRHNWKYAWFGEHHSLTEYSHMSAPEVVMGYCARATERIHLASGIVSLPPRKEHPVRIAERAAMLDHFTGGRYEFGTGRGAGSHEVASFNILDTNETKAEWDEVVREIPRMWEQKDYSFEGQFFTVPTPHNVLPKPYGKGHPPIWVACGNPPTFAKAGSLGIGAIAFNFEPIFNLKSRVDAYKEAIQHPVEQIGQFKNDNIMMTNAVICLSDRKRAREIALTAGRGYLVSLVNLYHDTMPKSPDARTWPTPPIELPQDEELLDSLIAGGYLLCGTPDEVCEQVVRYQDVGCDQVVFGLPGEGMANEEIFEMLELFGDKVIPEFDKDPVHSTTRYRENAKPRFDTFSNPVPDIKVEVIPTTALLPLSQ
jgi:alkanesulfonate monooxygenase SsuD/methylene tetrahydromethanopterin reductase-like flavin-dependent oxidoreductase (luciferase family)